MALHSSQSANKKVSSWHRPNWKSANDARSCSVYIHSRTHRLRLQRRRAVVLVMLVGGGSRVRDARPIQGSVSGRAAAATATADEACVRRHCVLQVRQQGIWKLKEIHDLITWKVIELRLKNGEKEAILWVSRYMPSTVRQHGRNDLRKFIMAPW